MLIYYIICMLITFFAIEYYITTAIHPAEHRLLPLVLGLIAVYDFYLIVEYATKATYVFDVLKELLVLQLMLLIFYYILDFMGAKLPLWLNIIIFSILTVENVFIVAKFYYGESIETIINAGILLVSAGILLFATISLIVNTYSKKIHRIYHWLYFGMLIPWVCLILDMFHIAEGYVYLPGALAIFCIIIICMEISGAFAETANYLKDNLFHLYDAYTYLFDPEMDLVEASEKAKEDFPDIIRDLELGSIDSETTQRFIQWAKSEEQFFNYTMGDKHYKGEVQKVYRHNKLVGYIFAFADITEEYDTLENAVIEARQKSSFLANMSHELRSPLHAIIGGAEIVIANGEMSSRSRMMVTQIARSGQQLLEKVNSILDYSKLEAGRLELDNREYNIRDLLENIIYNNYMALKDKPVELKMSFDTKIPRALLGDSKRTSIMIQNLLSNSVKFTNEGYIKCNLQAEELYDKKVRLTFTVEDTGIGIPKHELEEIFEEYKSTADGTVYEGTGLGLPLVKQIAELMNGEVSVTSDGSSGSCFTVSFIQERLSSEEEYYLPFEFEIETMFLEREDKDHNILPSWIYPNCNVLIVDDMQVNREIFRGMAMKWEFHIDEAASGQEAIDMVKDHEYDLVVMDHMMPGMSGIEAGDVMKTLTKAPIIISSANISDDLMTAVKEHDLAGYIPKPVEMMEFKKMIEDNLPAEKRDTAHAIDLTAGEILKDKTYELTLRAYVEELEELIPELSDYKDNDLDTYRVKVHGIKGISRQLGRFALGEFAEVMEMAAKAEHQEFIDRHFDKFIDEIKVAIRLANNELEGM